VGGHRDLERDRPVVDDDEVDGEVDRVDQLLGSAAQSPLASAASKMPWASERRLLNAPCTVRSAFEMPCRCSGKTTSGEPEMKLRADEALLCAVVKVTFDPAALAVPCLDDAPT
jgi:hypothetical protein